MKYKIMKEMEIKNQSEFRGIKFFFGDAQRILYDEDKKDSGFYENEYYSKEQRHSSFYNGNYEHKFKTISEVPPIKIGKDVTLYSPTIIYWGTEIGDGSIICANTVIRENTKIGKNTVIGTGTVIEGECEIGNNVTIFSQSHITHDCKIEDNVFIAPFLLMTNTPKIKHGRDFPLEKKGGTIKFGARIGGRVTMNPGVTIGENCLIGSGSVVTKDIPDRKIAFGSPAKVKGDVSEDEILKRKSSIEEKKKEIINRNIIHSKFSYEDLHRDNRGMKNESQNQT